MLALAKTWMRFLLVPGVLSGLARSAGAEEKDWSATNAAGEKAHRSGHFAEAEKQYRVALKIAEQSGTEDAHLGTTLNDLGVLYKTLGKYDKAEAFYTRSLTIWQKASGPDHDNVAQSLSNLGSLYAAQGKYEKAEPLLKRSLSILEKTLGSGHPMVANTLEIYGRILKLAHRDAEAEPLLARAKAIREKNGK